MAYILVIDDDHGLREAVAKFLNRAGHRVQEAGSGGEAMRLMEASPPSLVITDINMPEMDGLEVIVALRKARPELPIIAMSGGGLMPKETLLAHAGVLGAVATVAKPFEPAELLRAVESALGLSPR